MTKRQILGGALATLLAAGLGLAGATSASAAPEQIISKGQFESYFPDRDPLYTYEGFIAATASFPQFGTTGDEATQKRDVAAFLGNISHESGHLRYTRELDESNYSHYCDPGHPAGCPAGQSAYFGRGPIQLSWNGNYQAASQAIGLGDQLLHEPDLVATDSRIAWATAIWFWTTQSGAGSMSGHQAITSGAGFGEAVRSINGSIECNGLRPDLVQVRIDYFSQLAGIVGTDTGANLYC